MDLNLLIVFALLLIAITIVTLASVRIIKKYPAYGFAALTAFFVVYLVSSQVIATKLVTLDFGILLGLTLAFTVPAAAIIYPFIALILDMINEVYGRKKAVAAIIIAFGTQVLFVMFVAMAIMLPAADFFEMDEAWSTIFALSIGVTVASWVAFLVCSLLDAYLFSYIKRKLRPRELAFKGDAFFNPYIWLRSLVTDAVSMAVDSFIFVIIAFYIIGGFAWEAVVVIIIGQLAVKVTIGIASTPLFVFYKRMLGKTDLSDTKFVEGRA